MISQIHIKFLQVLFFCLCILSVHIWAQTPILDENGNETGLINLNPDPDGEPWIVGGLGPMTAEEKAHFESLPYFEVPTHLRGRQLPPTCDNTTKKEFRPIFNQKGGSCGQASGMGYHFTYERNLALGTLPTSKDNICAYGFTWNFINGGTGTGSWPSSGYSIAEAMGCGHVTDFNNADNGGSATAWMDGYKGYYNANDCHVIEQVKFQPTDIEALKNWFYDKGTGSGKNGGLVTFGSNTNFPKKTIQSGPFQGQTLVTSLTNGSAHAMTFAGYSDEIGYDLNGDGRITNDVDITRDGKVDINDWEEGAVQLVNSWGSGWMNGGKVWVLYSGIKCRNIIGIKVAKFETKMQLKVKVTHSSRGSLVLKTGFSSDINATEPNKQKSYGKAFNKAGGSHPMEGKGGKSTIEIGLDVTQFYTPGMPQGKFFLVANSSSGTINSMSLVDYTTGAPIETVCPQTNVSISGNTYLSVVKQFSPLGMVTPNGGEELERGTTYEIQWGTSLTGDLKIELLKGSNVQSVIVDATPAANNAYKWQIPANQELGSDYKIRISSLKEPDKIDESDKAFTIAEEYLIAKFPHEVTYDNLTSGSVALDKKWEQLNNDDFDWLVLSGPTPSKEYGTTGPNGDHTSGSGNYIYMEASNPNNPNKTASFKTPKFDLRNLDRPELSFYYHMFSDSNHMGELHLDIEVDGKLHPDVVALTDNNYNDQWHQQKVDLTPYKGNRVIFHFRGITGKSYASDICIDDFKIINTGTALNPLSTINPQHYTLAYYGNTIRFSIPDYGNSFHKVNLKLYNLKGVLVTSLIKDKFKSGVHSYSLNKLKPSAVPAPGMYLCRMEVDGIVKTINLIVKK